MSDDETKILTTAEAAAYLKVAPGTIENWRVRKVGPPYLRLNGRTVRYRQDELEEWVRQQGAGTVVEGVK